MAKLNIAERLRYVVSGEMSELRRSTVGVFGRVKGSITGRYRLDVSKVDYDMARSLYDNTNDDYKLGSGFSRVIVNNRAAFMGVPNFSSADKNAQVILDEFQKENKSNFIRVTVEFLRDGDCYVLVSRRTPGEKALYPEKKSFVGLTFIDPKAVDVEVDPVTHEPTKYIITQTLDWTDDKGAEFSAQVQQIHGVGYVETRCVTGDLPPSMKEGVRDTGLSFIPIQHFKNAHSHSLYGQSELEVVEPYMKVYHDVMLHAMQGSKMHSTPKLALYVDQVNEFKRNNFPDAGPHDEIDLTGREVFVFGANEKAEFIEPSSPTGAAKELLKLIFYNIVDASETPEFVFGVHTPSSLSSVKEQMPILVRSIERKREQMSQAWQRLARMVLYLVSGMSMYKRPESYATDILWDDIDYRTNEEASKEMVNVVTAITTAVASDLMSTESAVDYLSQIIDTMKPYDPEDGEGEKERIVQSMKERYNAPDREALTKEYSNLMKQLKELGIEVEE